MIDTCGLFVGCLLTCSSDEDTLTVDLIAPETGTYTIEYYFLENVIRFEIPGTIGVAFEIPGQYFNEYGKARIKIVNPDGTYFTTTVDGVIYETFYLVVKQTVDAAFIPASGGGGGAADNWGTQVVEIDATLVGDGTLATPLGVNTAVIATQVYADAAALAAADDWGVQVVEIDATLVGDGTVGTPLGVDVSVIATRAYADGAALAAADDWGSDVVNHDTSLTGNGTAGTPLAVDTTVIATRAYADAAAAAVAYTDQEARDAVGAMVDASLNYVGGTPLLQRAALTGAITASAGSNATVLGSFTKAQLDAAVSDGNVLYVGDVAIGAGLAFGTDNQIPFVNAAGTNFDYSANLTFNGSALAVQGSAVFNESGADVDFRIEGVGAANAFFVDGTQGNVGIGIAAPIHTLHVAGNLGINEYLYHADNGTRDYLRFLADRIIMVAGNDQIFSFNAGTLSLGKNTALTLKDDGKVGIGVTPVGAFLDIVAGTTANAQINLTPGVAKTTPLAGDVYNVNNNTYASTGAVTFGVGGVIFDNFADATVGGAVADIYTYTTPASTFGNNGDKVIASYSGNFVTVGTEIVQLKVLFAGTTIWDSTGIAVTTGTNSWRVGVELIRVSSTVVRYSVYLSTTGASGFIYVTVGELTALTLSNTNILKITGESSGVGSGSGDIVGKMAYGEFKPAR